MMAKEFFGRIILVRSIKRKELTADNLFEACRVFSLNERQINNKNFNYEYAAFNHMIRLYYENLVDIGDSLSISVSLDTRQSDQNISITINKKRPNENYNYTITFKNSISINSICGNSDPAFGKDNIEEVIELISKELADKLSKCKRWY